jgi:hypothetical protein
MHMCVCVCARACVLVCMYIYYGVMVQGMHIAHTNTFI